MLIRFNGLLARPYLAPFEGGEGAGGEEPELAEPVDADETEGEEEAEVAEQPTGKTDADARFAAMRRELEQAKADKQALEDALGNFFEGDTEQKIISAQAMAQNKTEEEIRAEIEAENERDRLEQENEQLSEELLDYQTRARMEHDLQEIQKIDPEVKDLDSLGKDYADYIRAGLTGTQAYYAMKAKESAEKPQPPAEIGKVNQSSGPKDFYTKEEVESMTQEEVHKNYDAIRKSMSQWG